MLTASTLLIVLALIFLLFAAAGVPNGNWLPLGLFCWLLAIAIGRVPLLMN